MSLRDRRRPGERHLRVQGLVHVFLQVGDTRSSGYISSCPAEIYLPSLQEADGRSFHIARAHGEKCRDCFNYALGMQGRHYGARYVDPRSNQGLPSTEKLEGMMPRYVRDRLLVNPNHALRWKNGIGSPNGVVHIRKKERCGHGIEASEGKPEHDCGNHEGLDAACFQEAFLAHMEASATAPPRVGGWTTHDTASIFATTGMPMYCEAECGCGKRAAQVAVERERNRPGIAFHDAWGGSPVLIPADEHTQKIFRQASHIALCRRCLLVYYHRGETVSRTRTSKTAA